MSGENRQSSELCQDDSNSDQMPIISLDPATQHRVQTVCLVVLAVLAATYLIYWLRPVLVPFVLALFVVSGLSPILAVLERTLGVTRIVAAAITFLAGFALLVIFGSTIVFSVADLGQHSDKYIQRVDEIVRELDQRFPLDLQLRQSPSGVVEPENTKSNASTSSNAPDLLESIARQGIAIVSQSLLNLISTSVVVLIFVFFLLLGTPSMVTSSATVHEINHQVRSYLALKTVISVFTGLAFGLALRLFGVPMAFTFGVLAFLLNFVPNVGPIVASLLPIPLIILDPAGNFWWMVAAITVTSMIQVISGNIVEPKIMGESSDLHPVVVLLSLMFWGMMWGVIGMFLATPMAAGFKIVLERFDETKPIAAFMAGRSMNEASLES